MAIHDGMVAALAEECIDDVISWRRTILELPEIGFEEVKTAELSAQVLNRLGLEVMSGVAGTGIVATLRGGQPGPTVALRGRHGRPATAGGNGSSLSPRGCPGSCTRAWTRRPHCHAPWGRNSSRGSARSEGQCQVPVPACGGAGRRSGSDDCSRRAPQPRRRRHIRSTPLA